jgi:hypothetical protein
MEASVNRSIDRVFLAKPGLGLNGLYTMTLKNRLGAQSILSIFTHGTNFFKPYLMFDPIGETRH